MRGRRPFVALVCVVASPLVLAAVAHADRAPTAKQHRQIAKVAELPPRCAAVRISTVTKKPKWASVSWKPGGAKCKPFAANGVEVVKKTNGRWRFITAGSSFDCGPLYKLVPLAVVQDLGISCI
jgi:hypothetical protein